MLIYFEWLLTSLAAVRIKSVVFKVMFPRATISSTIIYCWPFSRQVFVKHYVALFVETVIRWWLKSHIGNRERLKINYFWTTIGTVNLCSGVYPEFLSPSCSGTTVLTAVVTPGCLAWHSWLSHKLSSSFGSLVFSHNDIQRAWHLIRIVPGGASMGPVIFLSFVAVIDRSVEENTNNSVWQYETFGSV